MVLGKVLEGFNGCVFAYGQTGSGKTYTMTGTNKHPGVIPQLCAELFERVSALRKEGKCVEVRVQMCEIYNEKLKDLAHDDARDLAIREDSAPGGRGIYVDGLSSHVADDARSVLALVEDASKRRAIGQTDMNAHSSRSHAVVTLHIESWDKDDEERFGHKRSELTSSISRGASVEVDERGGRPPRGAAINLSLTALGNVISALTEGANRSHVPYRDSKLTRLLQNSLGGNSVTVMLCNASPAQLNAEETTSALQFAARPEDREPRHQPRPQARARRALYEENQLLRDKVRRLEAHIAELEKNTTISDCQAWVGVASRLNRRRREQRDGEVGGAPAARRWRRRRRRLGVARRPKKSSSRSSRAANASRRAARARAGPATTTSACPPRECRRSAI